jgi:hypothetical protein
VDIKAFNRKRIILAVVSAPFFFFLITYPFRLPLFDPHRKAILFASLVLALLVLYFNGSTLEQVREYHDQKIKADREAYEADKDAE